MDNVYELVMPWNFRAIALFPVASNPKPTCEEGGGDATDRRSDSDDIAAREMVEGGR